MDRKVIGHTRRGTPIYEVAGGAVGQMAARPQPQTTGQQGGAGIPFERLSAAYARPGYAATSQAFGASIDLPIPGAAGYLRAFDLTLAAVGGANATTNTVTEGTGSVGSDYLGVGADATPTASGAFAVTNMGTASVGQGQSPFAVVQYISVTDAFGTTLMAGPGYEMLHLVPKYSGQVGVLAASGLNKWPNTILTNLTTGTATTVSGNWFAQTRIPFEIVPGYGCLAVGDASLQPKLHIQLVGQSAAYATAPSTVPTFSVGVDQPYYGIPLSEPNAVPPGPGTTLQWQYFTCTPNPSASGTNRIQIGRSAGYVTTIILIARDANGKRTDDGWPARGGNNRIRLWVDSQMRLDETIEQRIAAMYESFGGLGGSNAATAADDPGEKREAGVIAYSFKRSESQANLGFLDNGNFWLPTSPGTLLEIECSGWGATASTITAVVGSIVPRGPIEQGIQILG